LKQFYDSENTFFKFDRDCSGTLEVNELHEMFAAQGLRIPLSSLMEIFNILDLDKSGTLDMQEFKTFNSNECAKRMFKDLVYERREKREKEGVDAHDTTQLPFDINVMLEYINHVNSRELLHAKIDESMEKTTQPAKGISIF
jgi:hypothetical protein